MSPVPPRTSLWMLAAAPGIWLGHFLLSYGTGAVWCAKFSSGGSLGTARAAIAGYTAAALVGLAIVGRRALRGRRGRVSAELSEPDDDRRFVAHVGLLLAGLAAVAVVYAAMVAVLLRSCD